MGEWSVQHREKEKKSEKRERSRTSREPGPSSNPMCSTAFRISAAGAIENGMGVLNFNSKGKPSEDYTAMHVARTACTERHVSQSLAKWKKVK